MSSTEIEKEVKPKATCPKCEGKAEFKWMVNNPFGKNLTYPEFFCWNCNLYFTVRKDI